MREEKLMSLTKGLPLALLLTRDFPLGRGENTQRLGSKTDDAGWRRVPTRWGAKDSGVGYVQTVTSLTLPLLGTASSSHLHRHSLRSHLPTVFTSRNGTRISHRSNRSYKKTVYVWTFWASLFFSVKEKAICKHSSIMSSQRRRKCLEPCRRSLPSRIIFILQKTLSQCYRTHLPVYSRDFDVTLYGLPSS